MANSNTIGVDSTLELFTTVLGWHQYEQIWLLLNDTGLVFLPFLGLLLRNVLIPIQSQQEGGASFTSLKRFELDLISALVVIVIAGQPLIELKHDQILHFNPCKMDEDNSRTFTQIMGVNDVEAYKDALFMLSADSAKIPIWWYAVLSISSGINNAVKHTMPCTSDMVVSSYIIHKTFINDTEENPLRTDIKKFMKDCYLPTVDFIQGDLKKQPELLSDYNSEKIKFRSKYAQGFFQHKYWLPTGTSLASLAFTGNIQALAAEWPGSDFMLNSTLPFMYKGRSITLSQAGLDGKDVLMSCRDYWLQPLPHHPLSIKQRLINLFDDKHLERLVINHRGFDKKVNPNTPTTEVKIQQMGAEEKNKLLDYAMMRVIQGTISKQSKNLGLSQRDFDDSSFQGSATAKLGQELGAFALMMKFLTIFPLAKVVGEGAPIAQACLLLALYMMLPIGLVFSGYSIQYLVVGAVGLFSLKFLGYVIYLAVWMNNTFYEALRGQGYMDTLYGQTDNSAIIEMAMVNAYFVLPILYLGIMGMAGYQLSTGVQGAFGSLIGEESNAGQSSQVAGQMVQTEVVNLGAKGLGKASGLVVKPVSVGIGGTMAAMIKGVSKPIGAGLNMMGSAYRRLRGRP